MTIESILELPLEAWLSGLGVVAAGYIGWRAVSRVGGIVLRWAIKPRLKTEVEELAEQAVKYLEEGDATWWLGTSYGWSLAHQDKSEFSVKVKGFLVCVENAEREVEVPYRRGGKAVLKAFRNLRVKIKEEHTSEMSRGLRERMTSKGPEEHGDCSCCEEDPCV